MLIIAVLISYLIAVIVAGDGGIPMGLLLVLRITMGGFDSWFAPGMIVGWIGIAGLVLTTFLFRTNPSKRSDYQFFASIILYLSWLMLAITGHGESGSLFSSFVLSLPFQIVFFFAVYRFVNQRWQTNVNPE